MLVLCLLCLKLACPTPLYRDCQLFRLAPSTLSSIFNDTLVFLAERYRKMLQLHPTITQERVQLFANALELHGGQGKIWSFIDGTFKGFCRPDVE